MAHTLFEEVIGAMPPSTVDISRIVARERRHRRRRSVLGAAAGTVAVVAAAALALGAAGSAPTRSVEVSSPSTHVLTFHPSKPFQHTYDWLSTTVDEALRSAAPETQWIRQPAAGADYGSDGDAPRFTGSSAGVGTLWGVRNGDLKGSIWVEFTDAKCLGDDASVQNCWSNLPCPPETCHRGTTPGGLRTVVMQYIEDTNAAVHVNRVMVALANGKVVSITVSNGFLTAENHPEYAPEPPLSIEEVENLAAQVSAVIAP
ncbi:MAG: hypothetical protein HOU81_16275 [Hamadaea sp.]|uniref:hypothetical protein n=1 Tax=Hamadaea sp. TaxID=2024425 RepID=UPI00183DC168|nr:hypothetical protein [Hamadaea sp.]NUR72372.1 hypothetical protein [Hamadaea sp.]NUT20273.1 hypothetical protein [Hamadaea sp.]